VVDGRIGFGSGEHELYPMAEGAELDGGQMVLGNGEWMYFCGLEYELFGYGSK
jgi:hypothetical protein